MNAIKEHCLNETSTDPYEIACRLMDIKEIPMHGPIHHFLDGAAFLTALHNAGMEFDLDASLDELEDRTAKMPGAICGMWGVCGSAASLGAALAVIHGTGPLSDNDFYKDNLRLTSSILAREAEIGGPRCCKRNCFTALLEGIDFVKEQYGVDLQKNTIICRFHDRNPQCIKDRCPYHS